MRTDQRIFDEMEMSVDYSKDYLTITITLDKYILPDGLFKGFSSYAEMDRLSTYVAVELANCQCLKIVKDYKCVETYNDEYTWSVSLYKGLPEEDVNTLLSRLNKASLSVLGRPALFSIDK